MRATSARPADTASSPISKIEDPAAAAWLRFRFVDKIVGGVGAAQLHPRRRARADRLSEGGPLGQPVVDLEEVALVDGQYYAVRQFPRCGSKMASRIATERRDAHLQAGAAHEPILKVTVAAPSESTSLPFSG